MRIILFTVILIKLGLDNEWISALIGASLVLFVVLVSEGTTPLTFMFTFYGFICAYAFMFGYKNGKLS